MTDLELQLLLAKKLSEKIKIIQSKDYYGDTEDECRWVENNGNMEENMLNIRPTEWLEIVRNMEMTLDDIQIGFYELRLKEICAAQFTDPISAVWQQRATALHQIGAI